MTDPEHLLRKELTEKRKSDLSAIQDMYLISTGYDGLGELLEAAPTTTKKKSSNVVKRKKVVRKVDKVPKTADASEPSEAAKKDRKRASGDSMYKSSNSVPDSMIQFAKEIHDIDRITPKEEITLGKKTQEAIQLQNVYDNLQKKLSREPTSEEWCAASGKINMEAISQSIEEGLEAKNTLVTANLRMVQGVVNVYIRNGLGGQYNAGDLMQEGIVVSSCSCLVFITH
jgi:hypothetical protein